MAAFFLETVFLPNLKSQSGFKIRSFSRRSLMFKLFNGGSPTHFAKASSRLSATTFPCAFVQSDSTNCLTLLINGSIISGVSMTTRAEFSNQDKKMACFVFVTSISTAIWTRYLAHNWRLLSASISSILSQPFRK